MPKFLILVQADSEDESLSALAFLFLLVSVVICIECHFFITVKGTLVFFIQIHFAFKQEYMEEATYNPFYCNVVHQKAKGVVSGFLKVFLSNYVYLCSFFVLSLFWVLLGR